MICESLLGGIIHGLHLPVSGLFVGSFAITCILLIAWYCPAKGMILQATLVVAIFKMMLSPQAGPPAYFAVFFQGLLGELLFHNRKYYRPLSILFAIICLAESGLQRILVMTILYGNDLWSVTNQFFATLTGKKNETHFAEWVAIIYVSLHIITGFFVGFIASSIPKRIHLWRKDKRLHFIVNDEDKNLKSSSKRKIGMILLWCFFFLLFVVSVFQPAWIPAQQITRLLIRSILIFLTWVLIVGPLIKLWLHRWLEKQKGKFSKDVSRLLSMLPHTKNVITQSWQQSQMLKGVKRFSFFIKSVLVHTLDGIDNLYIFTGHVGTGKTSALLEWSRDKQLCGILTPDIDGRRFFLDIETGDKFLMEAQNAEESLDIGRWHFSKRSFEKANNILISSIDTNKWLIIDEVGPLEIDGNGLYNGIKKIIETRSGPTILVVRKKDNMVQKVIARFGITDPVIIEFPGPLPG